MEKYKRLEKIIEEYLNREDIIDTFDETISLYTLVNLVEQKFNQLKKTLDTRSLLYKANSVEAFRKIFSKNRVEYHSIVPDFLPKNNSGVQTIVLYFNYTHKHFNQTIGLYKDVNGGKPYFIENNVLVDSKMMRDCQDDIENLFLRLEEYAPLFEDKKEIIKQEIPNEYFDISLNFNSLGNFFLWFGFNEKTDPENIQKLRWLNMRDIPTLLSETGDKIMKKIPVDVSILNPVCRKIVEERYEKERRKIRR